MNAKKGYNKIVKTGICVGLIAVLLIFVPTIFFYVKADEQSPSIQFINGTEMYIKSSNNNVCVSATIQNGNDNTKYVVWSFESLADIGTQEAKDWVRGTANKAYINNNTVNAYFNNLSVLTDTVCYFYVVEERYQSNIPSSSEESSDVGDAGNTEGQSIMTIYPPASFTFKPDQTAPTIENISAQTVNRWYWRMEYLDVAVTAKDDETGVQQIKVFIKTITRQQRAEGVDITTLPEQEETFYCNSNPGQNGVHTFHIGPFASTNEYIISAIAIDQNGNQSVGKTYLTDADNGFIYDDGAPEIEIAPHNTELLNRGNYYFSKENELFDVSIKDSVAGIKSFTIDINGTQISKDYEATENFVASFTDSTTKEIAHSIHTSQVTASADGSYRICVTAKDQAENETSIVKTLFIDNTAPVISGMKTGLSEHMEELSSEAVAYQYFTNEEISIYMEGTDGENGSGIKSFDYYLDQENGTAPLPTSINADENESASFSLLPNFKGFIYAKATDLLNNAATGYVTMSGIVAETADKHNSEEHISFLTQSTSNKDSNGNPLYAADTVVSVIVTDEFSGIAKVEWSVSAPNDSGNNKSGNTVVNLDGTLQNAEWEMIKSDKNLVTQLKKSIPVTNNSNDIEIKIKMTDRAGNVTEKTMKLSIDKTAPVIEIHYDNSTPDGVYTNIFKTARIATINVKERNFSAGLVETAITNSLGTVPTISGWTQTSATAGRDDTVYTATITFAADGEYHYTIKCKDLAGNWSNTAQETGFIVDQTKPVIAVSFAPQTVHNGFYYANARTATISVTEKYFDPARIRVLGNADNGAFPAAGQWTNNGDTHTANITFTSDGTYSFTIQGTDKAGNEAVSYTSESFVVDLTTPKVVISGVENMSANNGEVIPQIQFTDTHFAKETVSIQLIGENGGEMNVTDRLAASSDGLTYSLGDFPYVKESDDLYTLKVYGEDKAGNGISDSILFSVNRFGSVYIFGTQLKEINGTYVKSLSDVTVTEINVDELKEETIRMVLTVNGMPSTLIEGMDYEIEKSGGNGSFRQYEYRFNPTLFESDGTYLLSIYSVDLAGNVNENIDESKEAEISFGKDSTAPVILPINIEEKGIYNEKDLQGVVSIKDNLVLTEVSVWMNGEETQITSSEENYYFQIPESDHKQSIKVMAKDAAGNEMLCEINNLLVSTNFFIRWFHNKLLFWSTDRRNCYRKYR